MSTAQLKQQIIAESRRIGIDKIGFASAEPFSHLEAQLHESKALGYSSGFEHPVIEERLYPEKIFDQPKSIIAIALAYPTKIHNPAPVVRGERRGMFARASWGVDYHTILRDKMTQLIDFIRSISSETTTFKPMVDTGELIDVAVAARAGLGFIGKNGLLITKEFGSYVYLGEIITNIPFEPDSPVDYDCGDCNRCVTFCPTKALLGDGRLNAQRCLSFQTQTKGYMPLEYRKKIGHTIYGCDICQQVCPYNKGMDFHFHPEMEPDPESVNPLLKPMLTISNKDFKSQFGMLAGSWRGKKPLQRNAIIALANYRDRTAIPLLLEVMEKDTRPVIRGTAAWAIAEITRESSDDLIAFFTERLAAETDAETQQEIQQALTILHEKNT